MEEGSGGRGKRYFRLALSGKSAYDVEGKPINAAALTHTNMNDNCLEQLESMINKIIQDKKQKGKK